MPREVLKYVQRTNSILTFKGQKVLTFLNDIGDKLSRVLSARANLEFTSFRKTTTDRILSKRIVSSIALILFVVGIAGLAALVQAPPAHAIPVTYTITFGQAGIGGDFTGTIVRIDGTDYSSLPRSFTWAQGSSHKFAFRSPLVVTTNVKQYAWTSTSGLSTLQSDNAFTVTASGSITGNYNTQFRVRFNQNGVGGDFTGTIVRIDGTDYTYSSLPQPFWWDYTSVHSFAFGSPLVVTANVEQYVWARTSGGVSDRQSDDAFVVTGSGGIVGNYKTQFYLAVNTSPSGVDSPTGEGWYDAGVTAHVSTTQHVAIAAGSRYRFDSWTGAAGTYSDATVVMDTAKTATANYVTQYRVTFDQTGVGGDFTGTVLVVDGTRSFGVSDLPVSFWGDDGSVHSFAFQSPLVVTSNVKQYVWTSTSGLSSSQDGSVTVSGSGSVVGNYKTQYYLTMQVSPSGAGSTTPTSGWQDSGSPVRISAVGCGYAFSSWSGSGSSGKYTGTANPSSVTMNGPITETANFQQLAYGACILGAPVTPSPTVGQGSKVTFTITVHNTGTNSMPSSSTTVQVRIYGPGGLPAGGILVASPIDGFTPGAWKDVLVSYTLSTSAPLSPPDWTYDAYVYRSTTVLNHWTGGTFTVQTPSITGAILSATEGPNPVARGGTAAFSVIVQNTGNAIWPTGRVLIKIYGPTGSLATTLTLTISSITPIPQYTYNLSLMVPSGAATGTYRYDVYFYYGATIVDSKVSNPANTFTVS